MTSWSFWILLPFFACVCAASCGSTQAHLTEATTANPLTEQVEIDDRFRSLLPGDQLLANGAVRPVRLASGDLFLVSVGVVANPAPGGDSPGQAISLRRVALSKARSQLVEYCRVDVQAETELRTISTIRTADGDERLNTEERLDMSILLRARSVVQGAATVGTWYSSRRSTFHLALALRLQETP
jgi:hypothetical protein